jgi:hypothetical protein
MMQCDAYLMHNSIMKREQLTRRTTITFPAKTLAAAEKIARSKNVSLSFVIAEALEENIQLKAAAEREGERRLRAWNEYREAHSQFSEEERLLLDGIVLSEPVDDDR